MGESRLSDRPLLAIAPMIAVTNTHFRNLMRLLTKHSTLYTEMVVDSTILHNTHQLEDHLGFEPIEHPIVCQLGGSNPETVAEAATWVERMQFDEVNLNVGCPSSRVAEKGCFGAALMRTPDRVREIVHQMKRRVQIPVTVKCRLGVDEFDSPEFTQRFVETVAQGGCKHFIIHARKAWLQRVRALQQYSNSPNLLIDAHLRVCYLGVSAYLFGCASVTACRRVFALRDAFPDLQFSLNGGIGNLQEALALLRGEETEAESAESHVVKTLDGESEKRKSGGLCGVMIGRAAMNDPCCLAQADTLIYGAKDAPESAQTRRSLLDAYINYLERYESSSRKPKTAFVLLKPVIGVLSGMPGQRHFRQALDTKIRKSSHNETAVDALLQAMDSVDSAFPGVLDYPISLGKNPRYEELNIAQNSD